jgi:hypothetical protein
MDNEEFDEEFDEEPLGFNDIVAFGVLAFMCASSAYTAGKIINAGVSKINKLFYESRDRKFEKSEKEDNEKE